VCVLKASQLSWDLETTRTFVSASKLERPYRLKTLLERLDAFFGSYKKELDLAVVEAGAVGRFAKAALVVSEARGIALAVAARYVPQVREVTVQEARKVLGIASFGQRRDEGKAAVRRALGIVFGDKRVAALREDEADAAALAWWGLFALSGTNR
jgi:Holliday junction resolvasome RuvABC endonuclease subunit